MKSVLVIFALIGVTYVAGYDECKIEGITLEGSYFENKPIFDDHVGPILKIPKGTITEVKATGYNKNIAASIKGEEIVFELVKSLENYDYNTRTDKYNNTLNQEITLTCKNGSSYLNFYQTIADKNNHSPTFNRKIYTYKFGMDVAAGFELTDLLDIIVVDIDFTDYKITFKIDDNEYLKIEEQFKYDNGRGKTHYARLTTVKKIEGTFNKTYTITAEDLNEPKRTSEAQVKLIRV